MNANRIAIKEKYAIKCRIAEIVGWNIRDFELIPSGCRNGRPSWEIERHGTESRMTFTAFDANDIHGLRPIH